MKKVLLPVLMIIIAVLVMIPMFNASAERNKILGDADGDGTVSITDVTAIQLHLADYEQITAENFRSADVDGNGKIEIADASAIQRYLAEYDDSYGIGFALAENTSTAQTSTTKNYELPFVPA